MNPQRRRVPFPHVPPGGARALLVLLALLGAAGCKPRQESPPVATPGSVAATPGCLATGDGFLRAKLQGARDVQVDWSNAEISCEGGLRPDARGIRVSIAGPLHEDGERLRFVFGIGAIKQNESGRALPTNVTAILEHAHRIYATLGDDKCTVDELLQAPLVGTPAYSFRVQARGFCIAPATLVGGEERLLVSTFDFAGRITVEPESPAATSNRSTL
jgi:hypothetical protein